MLRSYADPRFIVTIEDGTNTWNFTDGPCERIDYQPAVVDVSAVAAEYSPESQRTQIGGVTITMLDTVMRPIINAHRMKGMKVTITLGEQSLPSAFFQPYFVGVIDETLPEPDGRNVRLICMDIWSLLGDIEITGAWLDLHPLEIVEDILDSKLGLDSSLWDATSLDPSDAAHAEHSHLVGMRAKVLGTYVMASDHTVYTPTSALELISQLMEVVGGNIIIQEDGKVRANIFDPSTAAVAHWDDTIIKDLVQVSNWKGRIFNRVSVGAGGAMGSINYMAPGGHLQYTKPQSDFVYTVDDTASQTNHGFGVQTSRVFSKVINNPWVMSSLCQLSPTNRIYSGDYRLVLNGTSDPATLLVNCIQMSGTRLAGASQPAWAKPSSTRPVYLLVRDAQDGGQEILKMTTAVSVGSGSGPGRTVQYLYPNPDGDPEIASYTAHIGGMIGTFARAQLGTTKRAFNYGAFAMDITPQVYMANKLLARYSEASPKISVTTSIDQYAVQLGDLITIDWPEFLFYNADGIDNTTKWEVVSKSAKPPMIEWVLVRAVEGTPTKSHATWGDDLTRNMQTVRQLATKAFTDVAIVQGLTVTATGGFGVTVSVGVSSDGLNEFVLLGDGTDLTMAASKDTYLYQDITSGGVVREEVALGAAEPAPSPNLVPIAKVTTDGSGVTSVADRTRDKDGIVTNTSMGNSSMYAAGSLVANGDFGDWGTGGTGA